jgi:hypothetical protein
VFDRTPAAIDAKPRAPKQKRSARRRRVRTPFATVLPLNHIARPRSKDPNESSKIAIKWQERKAISDGGKPVERQGNRICPKREGAGWRPSRPLRWHGRLARVRVPCWATRDSHAKSALPYMRSPWVKRLGHRLRCGRPTPTAPPPRPRPLIESAATAGPSTPSPHSGAPP